MRWDRPSLTGVAALACFGLAGCGGSGGKVSASSLKGRLMPASFVTGFSLQRTFDWKDPVNLLGEGLLLPEATRPADALAKVRKAGFKGGTGERLTRGRPPDEDDLTVGVLKLASASKATALRDYLHGQDLQQPCYTACVFSPNAISVRGVPSAMAVAQKPTRLPKPPPGARVLPGQGPPTRYFIEFTVGPYLYFSNVQGPASAQKRFVATTKRYYDRVRSL
jgi:hypothetical protein